jgi:hypothetical protein
MEICGFGLVVLGLMQVKLLVLKVQQVQTAQCLDHRGSQVHKVLQDQQVHKAHKVKQVLKVCKVLQEPLVLKAR